MADTEQIREEISGILAKADLNTITAKKVRQQLQDILKVDLTDRRKEIDSIVMEIVNTRQSESEELGKRRKQESGSEDDGDDDYSPAKKAKGGSGAAAPAAKGAKKAGGTGYTKTCRLSPELARVMGEDAMARHEVVKRMWKIIKEKNLYDPKNKQFAICNDELLPIFGVKRFRTFGMMKYLKNHFTD